MTCPGSSVGSEYLTTNQRVGGSSPSQDTILNPKIFKKKIKKGIDKQSGILYHCKSRCKAVRKGSDRVQTFSVNKIVLANGQRKKRLTRKALCDTMTKPICKSGGQPKEFGGVP